MAFQPILFSGFTTGGSSGGGGGGSPTIGGSVVGGTANSVLFVGAGNVLSQDTANFNYNATTHNLAITGTVLASNISGSNTGDVTIGTANGLSIVGQVLSLGLSSTSTNGALSSTDWNTFNNKQPTFTSQTANLFFASPNGSSGVPSFRSIVAADIPSLSATYVTQSEVGAPNGVASLDGAGKIPVAQLGSAILQYEGGWNPNTNTPALSDGTGTNGFVYYITAQRSAAVSGLTDPSMVNFQIGNLIIYSTSVGKWQQTTPAAGVSSVNNLQGAVTVNAINQLTGDVTAGPATLSQSKVATIAQIQGNPVGGTTGTGNVVFSSAPTITGLLSAGSAVFTSTISASNLSGTNTGDQTITLTGEVTGSGTGSFATTLSNAAVIAKVLTGFVSGPNSPIIATDSILQGLEKLQAQVSASGSGSVTSVALSLPSIFTVTGSPITTNGTLTGTLNTQSANLVFAGPSSGGPAIPTFRSLVSTDIPSLSAIYLPLVGGTMSGAIDMGTNQIHNVTNPSSPQDAATKSYVDAHSSASSPGDLSEGSFTAADNQSIPANITGFAFANGTVRSFDATVSIVRDTTYDAYKLYGIQKTASWELSQAFTGDVTGISFSITAAGQIQYTSTSTGFTSLIKFRAITTSV